MIFFDRNIEYAGKLGFKMVLRNRKIEIGRLDLYCVESLTCKIRAERNFCSRVYVGENNTNRFQTTWFEVNINKV